MDNEENRLKKLKNIPFDKYTAYDIQFLRKKGIINGVGASWQKNTVRKIMTKLFHFLEYERHDVAFWKGGTEKDFHNANWGLLKYSFISIADEYRQMHKIYGYSLIWRAPVFVLRTLLKTQVILYAYIVVESDLSKKSFNFNK